MTMFDLPPGSVLVLGSLLLPWLRGRWQQACLLVLPAVSLIHLLFMPHGTSRLEFMGLELTPIHVDRLSLVWGYIFHIAAFVGALYATHLRDTVQHVSSFIYAGAAIAAVFAGDLITLFVFWEMTAISSVFLVWARRTPSSYSAGMRYLIMQVTSGVLLLSGVLMHFHQTGSLAFVSAFQDDLPVTGSLYNGLNSPGTLLIFLAFGIKAAFPLLHAWLKDAYAEATPTGTVFLSVFSTKLAIYSLARGFPGTEVLIWIGTVMAAFPIVYAILENDLRRVLSYSLISTLGYMVVGIGLADFAAHPETAQLALNGTAAHAVTHVLYKGLLFMSMGAVLFRTGTAKGSELGGLYKSMPWTTAFCMVGAASIAAFPLFCGFVSKSMILSAVAKEHYTVVWLVLLCASASMFYHSGIKIPFFAFFARDSGQRVKEAPINMLIAMGILSVLCIGVGVFPGGLYSILPYETDYQPYTLTHVVTQYQLLMWSALAFTILYRTGIHPPELASQNLDIDWFYRKPLPAAVHWCYQIGGDLRASTIESLGAGKDRLVQWLNYPRGPHGIFIRSASTSSMVIWVALLLTAYLLAYYI